MKDPLIDQIEERGRKSTSIVLTNRAFSVPIEGKNPYLNNKISTCKYNALTFLPKNFFEQFQKLANVYFIIVAILQSIPDISNSGGYPSILLPLGLVVMVTATKDALEDSKRRKSDDEENNRTTLIRKNGTWQKVS